MRAIDAELIREAGTYVRNLFSDRLKDIYVYHSIDHTLGVEREAVRIGRESGLDESELKLVRLSALFHDAGYVITGDNHEEESALIAGEFLATRQVAAGDIKTVVDAILSTRIPQKPLSRVAETLCDADLAHLAGEDYFSQMDLLRREWEISGRHTMTELQFHENSVLFFNNHHYHSTFGKSVLELKKKEILDRIIARIAELR